VGIDSIFEKSGVAYKQVLDPEGRLVSSMIPNVFEHRSADYPHHRKVNALLRGILGQIKTIWDRTGHG